MSKTLKDFSREKVYRVCDQYIHSPNDISAAYFCQELDCNEGVFYNILHMGVKAQIIPDEWIPLLIKKSSDNSYLHGDEGGRQLSIRSYEWCIEKRKNFQFNNKETAKYAFNYACSPLSAAEYARQNYMPKKLLCKTLQRAIVDNLVKEDIVIAMRIKALKFHPEENVNLFFNKMMEQRKEKIRLQKAKKEARKNRKKFS